jgi:hypothetical protein
MTPQFLEIPIYPLTHTLIHSCCYYHSWVYISMKISS